jgi:hypothetical protein
VITKRLQSNRKQKPSDCEARDREIEVRAMRLQSDCEVIVKRKRRDSTAIAEQLEARAKREAIAKREIEVRMKLLRCNCDAIAMRLRSDYKAKAKRYQSRSEAI